MALEQDIKVAVAIKSVGDFEVKLTNFDPVYKDYKFDIRNPE